MMATAMSQESVCSLVMVETQKLRKKAGHKPDYHGIVVIEDTLLVIDRKAYNLQRFSRGDGRLLSTSQRLESFPMGVCLLSKTEVAVCLSDIMIVILAFESIDDIKLVKTFDVSTGFDWCHSVAKFNSRDKLVVSGVGLDGMLCWGVVWITDEIVDSTHNICKWIQGHMTHLAIHDSTVYISCRTHHSTTAGVYAYDTFNPLTPKFLYRHQELKDPWSIVAGRDCVLVSDYISNRIHQLTDSGQLVTIHTVSSRPREIFSDDQHGVLYTTGKDSNVITVYRLEYLQEPGVKKNNTGLMKAETDQTEAVYVLEQLVQRAKSVGIIRSPSICGTGFRVGSCYVMTAKHVVDGIMNVVPVPIGQHMQQQQYQSLNDPNVFIDFSYEMNKPTSDGNLIFHFEKIVYANDELDTAVLQLKLDTNKIHPPPLTHFTQPPNLESQCYLIGHSKGEIKKKDTFNCVKLTPHEIAVAREWSMKRVNVDGFVGIEDSRRVLLHCSFEKGASGSPGFWIDPSNGQAWIVLMLLRGFPEWYYNEHYKDQRIGVVPRDLIEQGVCMAAIYDDMNSKVPSLCQEIFCHK